MKTRSVSKHKQGIFNDACELSVLCKAQTAVIAFSPNFDKDGVQTFGNPNPDSVINRYIHAGDDDRAWEEIAKLSQEVEEIPFEDLKAFAKSLEKLKRMSSPVVTR
ncbi:hypothetical protein L6164_004150 [Bauhinia variegata]|uniref:Uncharacterized protein n=1 Tax=Bauhinia variegata TaxID=167791 RepID=A0ACB9Q5I4_BAUVA|nr:hypothetical protein L6164_004150 [Bauhinia variegata]